MASRQIVVFSTNSPADSNGDEYFGIGGTTFGSVIDRFGVVGEDGFRYQPRFEDGRA